MTTDPKAIARLRELHNTVYTQPMTTEFPSLVTSEYIMLIKQHLASLLSDAERVGEMEAKVRELGEDNFAARMYASNMERCSKESDARVQELERQLGIAVGALESMAGPVHCGCEPCTGQCRSEPAKAAMFDELQDYARTTLSQLKEPA